jgi:nucleoside 2-deoxyribosyltransferase
MKKVFLATSFSGKVDMHTGQVLPAFRAVIENLLRELRKDDVCEVFCAVEHEGWMIANNVPPEVGVQKDLQAIEDAEVVVALMDNQPSAGVQFELGYAAAKGKQIVVAHHAGEKLAYFNQGAVSFGLMTQLAYETSEALIGQLTVAITAPANEV